MLKRPLLSDSSKDDLERGQTFHCIVNRAGAACRKLAEKDLGDWLIFREFAFALLVRSVQCKAGICVGGDFRKQAKTCQIASFLQGAPWTVCLILESQHVKAAAALKQEIEIVTRIREFNVDAAKNGKTPQMKYAPPKVAKAYGFLNKVAHPSHEDILIELLDCNRNELGTFLTPLPSYVPHIVESNFSLHAWLCFELCWESINMLIEDFSEQDRFVEDCMRRYDNLLDKAVSLGLAVEVENPGTPLEAHVGWQ